MSNCTKFPVAVSFDDNEKVLHGRWVIHGFKDITTKVVVSDIFSHPSAPYTWSLKMFPKGRDDSLSLSQFLFSGTRFPISVVFFLGYEDKNGKETFKERSNYKFTSSAKGYGKPNMFTTEYALDKLVKQDGSLVLVEIDYGTLKWDSKTQISHFKLGLDLGLALGGDYSDVVLNVGQQSIKAHKVIITSRSKYFKAMFDANSREAQTGVIGINDFVFAVVRGFLEFIYSGAVELTNVVFALSLRLAADKYELLELVAICEDYIVSNVDKKNAVKAIISTKHVESNRIREACLEVFRKRVDYDDIDNFDDVYEDPVLRKYVVNAKVIVTF